MATFKAITGTDGQYNVYNPLSGVHMGIIRKVYTGRSASVWTIDPDGYVPRTTLRVGYESRKVAFDALSAFTENPHRTSLVEG